MSLIKSISGIRGTIGGKAGEGLTPLDVLKFTAAYAVWLKENAQKEKLKIVVGRDARISGPQVEQLVTSTLSTMGVDVLCLGMASTPTVEVAVVNEMADGGIIITASHNPKEWNALKLLNEKGEFLSAQDGEKLLSIADEQSFSFAEVDALGSLSYRDDYTAIHCKEVCDLPQVDVEAIRKADFSIVVDPVNSVGGIAIPELLHALGVKNVTMINGNPDGVFAHNPEPLPAHLTEISAVILQKKADLGLVVDPDVDRLAIVCEDGSMFGEEYTLVAVADYILSLKKGSVVSNLSSSRALKDLTESYGSAYYAAAVGEVNVVAKMKEVNAVIGGEGNGGVILPAYHYGRDALVGIALFLTHLAKQKDKSCLALRAKYPAYFMSKNKIELSGGMPVDKVLKKIQHQYKDETVSTIDGVKIDFSEQWVHLRKSNTEPIIRIYTEAKTQELADKLAKEIMTEIKNIVQS